MIPVQSNYEHGRTEQDGRVYLDYARRFVLGHAAFDAVTHKAFIPVDKGAKVLDVRVLVTDPMNAALTLKVGDGATADGYLKIGDLDPAAAAGTFERSFRKSTEAAGNTTFNAYAEGKAYVAAGGLIILELSADPTQGALEVEVVQSGYAAVGKDVVS